MYNPYEAEILRRRQQQPEISQPTFQQPAPMAPLPAYGGPELMPWMPEDGQQQANESAGAAGQGMGMLIKRFKPQGGTGSLGEHGPR